MKGYFIDSKDWTIEVGGDWRDSKGKVLEYNPKNKNIFITDGLGQYYYQTGNFGIAITYYLDAIYRIKEIEKEQKHRFHKGLFYFNVALCYEMLGDKKNVGKYLGLAKRQDKITYGSRATDFPAFKAKKSKSKLD